MQNPNRPTTLVMLLCKQILVNNTVPTVKSNVVFIQFLSGWTMMNCLRYSL